MMIPKKYLKDYKVAETYDENGEAMAKVIYIAGEYAFEPPVTDSGKKKIVALAAAGMTAIFISLFLISPTGIAREVHIMIPHVLSVISMLVTTFTALALLRSEATMMRVDAEKVTKRLSPFALISAILNVAAITGVVISAVGSPDSFLFSDAVFVGLMLIMAASCATIFALFHKVKPKKVAESMNNAKLKGKGKAKKS